MSNPAGRKDPPDWGLVDAIPGLVAAADGGGLRWDELARAVERSEGDKSFRTSVFVCYRRGLVDLLRGYVVAPPLSEAGLAAADDAQARAELTVAAHSMGRPGARLNRRRPYPTVIVALDDRQHAYAARIARQRQATAPANQAHGCTGGLAEHLLGACGEMAFGAWLHHGGPFELSVGTYRSQPDLAGCEVRTRGAGHWDLLIRDDDDPALPYVLVVPYGSGGRKWRLPGWCWGHEARRAEWTAHHGGREDAWFVPQAGLRPMPELAERIACANGELAVGDPGYHAAAEGK